MVNLTRSQASEEHSTIAISKSAVYGADGGAIVQLGVFSTNSWNQTSDVRRGSTLIT